jgi:hypothetical protein
MSDRPSSDPQPSVVLDVDFGAGFFEFVLANIGTSVAHDITVGFSRKVIGAEGMPVTALPIFDQLRTLRPGKEVRIFIDSAVNLFRRRKTNVFAATVRWSSTSGDQYKATYRHDLDIYRGLPQVAPTGLNDA